MSNSKQVSKEITVTNKLGIHARPAAMFVKLAGRFECHITVEQDGEQTRIVEKLRKVRLKQIFDLRICCHIYRSQTLSGTYPDLHAA